MHAKLANRAYQTPEDDRIPIIAQGVISGYTRETQRPTTYDTPGADMYLGTCRGQQGGENGCRTQHGRSRHAAQSVETSGGGWWVAGVDEDQVYNVPQQERKWGAGVTKRELMLI